MVLNVLETCVIPGPPLSQSVNPEVTLVRDIFFGSKMVLTVLLFVNRLSNRDKRSHPKYPCAFSDPRDQFDRCFRIDHAGSVLWGT